MQGPDHLYFPGTIYCLLILREPETKVNFVKISQAFVCVYVYYVCVHKRVHVCCLCTDLCTPECV